MFNSKTYFEQVPLEFVKRIVEEQMRTEPAGDTREGIDKEAGESLPEADGRFAGPPGPLAKVEALN